MYSFNKDGIPVVRIPTIAAYIEMVEGVNARNQYNDIRKTLNDDLFEGDFKDVAFKVSTSLLNKGFRKLSRIVGDWLEYSTQQISSIPYNKGKVIWTN